MKVVERGSLTGVIAGVDIGGTKIATVLTDLVGRIIDRRVFPTETGRGPVYAVDKIRDSIRAMLEYGRASPGELVGIGVACGGPLNTEAGVILSPPNLPRWDRVPIKDILSEDFGVRVAVENDANAGALAELIFGVGKERAGAGCPVRNLIYLTMGTGIGGGLILEGKLYKGATGSAGEIGHTKIIPDGPLCGCGRRGCLEALCSGPSIARRAREALSRGALSLIPELAGSVDKVTAKEVFDAARLGDGLAVELVWETAEYLGIGLANLVNLLNPELIVLGTIATKVGDLLLDPVRKVVAREAWEEPARAVEIRASSLGEYVGDYGAVAVIRQALEAGM